MPLRFEQPRRTPRLRRLLVGLVGLAVVGLGAVMLGPSIRTALFPQPGDTACPTPANGCLRVLFVGNSYTAVNDLPHRFAAIAAEDGRTVEVAAVAPGGVTLTDHAAASETRAALASRSWDVVVLQDQSDWPAAPGYARAKMIPAIRALAGRAPGARVVLYETPAHEIGYPDLGLAGYLAGQAAISAAYETAAAAVAGATLARVGDAWRISRERLPAIGLWQSDGSHPAEAGTYLAACVIYEAVFGAPPSRTVAFGDLDGATAGALISIAGEVR